MCRVSLHTESINRWVRKRPAALAAAQLPDGSSSSEAANSSEEGADTAAEGGCTAQHGARGSLLDIQGEKEEHDDQPFLNTALISSTVSGTA